ncbi:MAG: redoxin domain-containing protein [Anaerolineales bacterium]|nr:redoxin domain-containing protein [Anaerolineales bacterium]
MKRIFLILGLLITTLAACSGQPAVQTQLQPAPDFTLPNALGGEVSLTDYRGKQPVFLFFHMAVG